MNRASGGSGGYIFATLTKEDSFGVVKKHCVKVNPLTALHKKWNSAFPGQICDV